MAEENEFKAALNFVHGDWVCNLMMEGWVENRFKEAFGPPTPPPAAPDECGSEYMFLCGIC